MPNTPTTLQFGPWAPDSSNQGFPVPWGPSLGAVPLADCVNVRFADGNWLCAESPQPVGPALSEPAVAAFTWYDNTGSQEIVFAGTADGVQQLVDGVWSTVPLANASAVTIAKGFSSVSNLGGLTQAVGFKSTTKLGAVTITATPAVKASVDGGRHIETGSSPSAFTFTLNVTVTGGTPSAWSWTTDTGTIASPNSSNPTLTVSPGGQATVGCTVVVNGRSIVATPNVYTVIFAGG